MAAFMVRIADDKYERLKVLAKTRGMSLNKLMEELNTVALADFDAETRLKIMAAQGNPERGISILNKLDADFGKVKE